MALTPSEILTPSDSLPPDDSLPDTTPTIGGDIVRVSPLPYLTFGIGPASTPANGRPSYPLTDFTTMRLVHNLMNGPSAAFSMPALSTAAQQISGRATDLWVYRQGVLWQRLRILDPAQSWGEDSGSTVDIIAVGYGQLVAARYIIAGPGLPAAVAPSFVNIDQGAIAWGLVQHTQAQNGGDLGITQGTILTGQLRDRTEYRVGDNIGPLLANLARVENGVSVSVDAYKVFTARLFDDYPSRPDPIVLGVNARAMAVGGGVPYANVAGAIGSRDVTTPTFVETDDLLTDPRGRWETVDTSHTDVIVQATVDSYASGLLAERRHPPRQWTIVLDPSWFFDLGSSYAEGEFVRVVVPVSSVAEIGPPSDALAQITEVQITEDETGAVVVTVAAVELASIPVNTPPPTYSPPASVTPPSLSSPGSSWTAGSTWSASPGAWTNASGFSYAWEQAPTAGGPWETAMTSDPGGNRSTAVYAPPVADAGLFYSCVVTAVGPGGQMSARSDIHASVAPVVVPPPTSLLPPVASVVAGGPATAGTPLTVSTGTWTGTVTGYAYFWQSAPSIGGTYTPASASSIGGSQVGSTYVPPLAEAGRYYRARVTASGPGGSTAATSNSIQTVAPAAAVLIAAPPAGYALFGGTFTLWNSTSQTQAGYDVWRGFARKPADLIHYYIGTATGWNGTISSAWITAISVRPGRRSRLAVNWKIASNMSRRAVADGGNDGVLTTFCNNIKLWDDIIYVILDHEYDNNTYAAGTGNDPEDQADMIRHVTEFCTSLGVTNVNWGVCPTGYSSHVGTNGSFYNRMWPGDWDGSRGVHTIWWDPYWQSNARGDLVLSTSGAQNKNLLNENISGTTGWTGMLNWARAAKTVGVNGLRYPFAGTLDKGIAEWGTWFEVNQMNGAIDTTTTGLTDSQAEAKIRFIGSQFLTHAEDVKYWMHYHLNLLHTNHLDGNPLSIDALGDVANLAQFSYDLGLLS